MAGSRCLWNLLCNFGGQGNCGYSKLIINGSIAMCTYIIEKTRAYCSKVAIHFK